MSAFKFQWVPHNGGPMPVSADTLVEVRFRNTTRARSTRAGFWEWGDHAGSYDIVAYRVIEVRP